MNALDVLGLDAALAREAAVRYLLDHLGAPYIWGGHRIETGVDCSGAVMAAWIAAGIVPEKVRGHFAADDIERSVKSVSREELQPGDLVFYGSKLKPGATHVMMYAGEGKVVGATGGGHLTTTVEKAREQDAAVKVKPYDYRKDIRGYGQAPVGPAGQDFKKVPFPYWKWALIGGGSAAALGGLIYMVSSVVPRRGALD